MLSMFSVEMITHSISTKITMCTPGDTITMASLGQEAKITLHNLLESRNWTHFRAITQSKLMVENIILLQELMMELSIVGEIMRKDKQVSVILMETIVKQNKRLNRRNQKNNDSNRNKKLRMSKKIMKVKSLMVKIKLSPLSKGKNKRLSLRKFKRRTL